MNTKVIKNWISFPTSTLSTTYYPTWHQRNFQSEKQSERHSIPSSSKSQLTSKISKQRLSKSMVPSLGCWLSSLKETKSITCFGQYSDVLDCSSDFKSGSVTSSIQSLIIHFCTKRCLLLWWAWRKRNWPASLKVKMTFSTWSHPSVRVTRWRHWGCSRIVA